MKIRNGYVSNSSSSSFCVWGICLNDFVKEQDELDQISDKLWDLNNKFRSHNGIGNYPEELVFVGLIPSEQKDDQTLLEFKEKIVKTLNECNINASVKDINLFYDGGYEG